MTSKESSQRGQYSASGELRPTKPIKGLISETKLATISHDVAESTLAIRDEAMENAIQRSDHTEESKRLIENAINGCFVKHVYENNNIAEQLCSEEYEKHAEATNDFLKPIVLGAVLCADERLAAQAVGDPRVITTYRTPQGLVGTRLSTKSGVDLPNDFYLLAGAEAKIVTLGEKIGIGNVELMELWGPHIDSRDPVGEGCSVAISKAMLGAGLEEMKQGYLEQFFKEQGNGYRIFDNVATRLTANSTTLDFVFDTATQGSIIGLRKECKNFSPDASLLDNLMRSAKDEEKILMTELVGQKFHDSIWQIANSMGIENPLNPQLFANFANNAIIIGRVARELTIQQQEEGFNFIPKPIKEGKSPAALKAIAYLALRNAAYLVLGDIQPETHFLRNHVGKIVRVGPIGGKHLVENPTFIHNTPQGGLNDADLPDVQKIIRIARSTREKHSNELDTEGMIVLSTVAHNDARYSSRNVALTEAILAKGTVRSNAAKIRGLYGTEVKKGKMIVLGCVFNPDTNELTSVV